MCDRLCRRCLLCGIHGVQRNRCCAGPFCLVLCDRRCNHACCTGLMGCRFLRLCRQAGTCRASRSCRFLHTPSSREPASSPACPVTAKSTQASLMRPAAPVLSPLNASARICCTSRPSPLPSALQTSKDCDFCSALSKGQTNSSKAV